MIAVRPGRSMTPAIPMTQPVQPPGAPEPPPAHVPTEAEVAPLVAQMEAEGTTFAPVEEASTVAPITAQPSDTDELFKRVESLRTSINRLSTTMNSVENSLTSTLSAHHQQAIAEVANLSALKADRSEVTALSHSVTAQISALQRDLPEAIDARLKEARVFDPPLSSQFRPKRVNAPTVDEHVAGTPLVVFTRLSDQVQFLPEVEGDDIVLLYNPIGVRQHSEVRIPVSPQRQEVSFGYAVRIPDGYIGDVTVAGPPGQRVLVCSLVGDTQQQLVLHLSSATQQPTVQAGGELCRLTLRRAIGAGVEVLDAVAPKRMTGAADIARREAELARREAELARKLAQVGAPSEPLRWGDNRG